MLAVEGSERLACGSPLCVTFIAVAVASHDFLAVSRNFVEARLELVAKKAILTSLVHFSIPSIAGGVVMGMLA